MLVFVIPLRNPETAQNWERCNALCQQTVRSALAQSDPNVRVIVIGKDFTPDTDDQRLIVIRRPFQTPPNTWDDRAKDKYLKIGHGLVEARRFAPCYIMKLDADDLIGRNLAATVRAGGAKPGYYIPRGYRWSEGSRFVRSIDNFHLACGSSNIIWCEPHDLPASHDEDFWAYRIMRLGHHVTTSSFEELGTPLIPIAARSAIYRTGHGENFTTHLTQTDSTPNRANWKFYVGQALRLADLRPFTPSMRRDFFG